jgi:hypothetical protein
VQNGHNRAKAPPRLKNEVAKTGDLRELRVEAAKLSYLDLANRVVTRFCSAVAGFRFDAFLH